VEVREAGRGRNPSMCEQKESPFCCHVFVCTNDRKGARISCADGEAVDIRSLLKKAVAERGWRGRVRVSQSGCLGLCEEGPNVLLYPQKIWFSGVKVSDCDKILAEMERAIQDDV